MEKKSLALSELSYAFRECRKLSEGKKRVIYTENLRRGVVELYLAGAEKRDLVEALGISYASLLKWIEMYAEEDIPDKQDAGFDQLEVVPNTPQEMQNLDFMLSFPSGVSLSMSLSERHLRVISEFTRSLVLS